MARGKRAGHTRTAQQFAQAIVALSKDPSITVGNGKGSGRSALRAKDKLSKVGANALVGSAVGKRFEPGPDLLLKECIVVTGLGSDWVKLAKKTREFVNFTLGQSKKDVRHGPPQSLIE